MARIRELKQELGVNTPGQHVVSRVVLKRFTDHDGMVLSVSVRNPKEVSRLKGTKGVGKVPNFVPVASTSAEGLWAELENKLPRPLELCDSDKLHVDQDALNLIRDAIALHYIRSQNTPQVHVATYRQARAAALQIAMVHPLFKQELVKRYGTYAVGSEVAGALLDELFVEHDENFASGLMFRVSVEKLFAKAKAWFSNKSVELLHPANGSFLIGDTPALTISQDGRVGPAAGVALGDAEQIIMPISPRTCLAIGPANGASTIGMDVVEVLNTLQIRAAHDYVFTHPDSELEDLVRKVRFATS